MTETVARQGVDAKPAGSIPLEVLDVLPDIRLPDSAGQIARLSTEAAGRKLLLLLCADPRVAAVADSLRQLADRGDDLWRHCAPYVVTLMPPEINSQAFQPPLPITLLADVKGQVFHGLGLDPSGQAGLSAVLTNENNRILRIERDAGTPTFASDLLRYLETLSVPAPRRLGHMAPVLYVPQVFEPAFCDALIAFYEHEGGVASPGYAEDLGVPQFLYDGSKVRRDCRISDERLIAEISRRVTRRVLPDILKAFTRLVTGIEKFKIGCYEASEGGRFKPHRDNKSKGTAHRRFAMSVNLNTGDYEGGFLRFPEYGPDLYRPERGDAVVYSSSLLHEVTPVTAGRRFTLLAHMYDEESRALNPKYRTDPPPA